MLEKTEYKLYKDGDYIVEMSKSIKEPKCVDFYISHINYGIKSLMFCVEVDFNDNDALTEFILGNIEDCKESYQKEFED